MRKYFLYNGQVKVGPLTLEDLKHHNIKPKHLIWHEGLDDWIEAENIHEIKDIIEVISTPVRSDNKNFSEVFKNLESDNVSKSSKMFSHPFSFRGRIRRTEYGISFILFLVGLNLVMTELEHNIDDQKSINIALVIISFLLWFIFAQGAKREHDLGFSGWWQLFPFRIFWLIFLKGEVSENKYGHNPKS